MSTLHHLTKRKWIVIKRNQMMRNMKQNLRNLKTLDLDIKPKQKLKLMIMNGWLLSIFANVVCFYIFPYFVQSQFEGKQSSSEAKVYCVFFSPITIGLSFVSSANMRTQKSTAKQMEVTSQLQPNVHPVTKRLNCTVNYMFQDHKSGLATFCCLLLFHRVVAFQKRYLRCTIR